MNWPPMLVHIRIENRDHDFAFWFPLFLIGLIVLAFMIAFSPLVLLAILILWPVGWGKRLAILCKTIYLMMCALRGTKVDIQGRNDEVVYISIV